MQTISIIDTQAGGTRIRLVLEGGLNLGRGPLSMRAERFRRQYDHVRLAVLAEVRHTSGVAGALLCEPYAPRCSAGVVFFDAAGLAAATAASLVGLTIALAGLGRITAGRHRIDTPSGVAETELHADGSVTIPGHRHWNVDGAFFSSALHRPGFSIHEYRNLEHFLLARPRAGETRTTNRIR
ncbi:MAG TPA: proline racemase family protein [Noviherbaspirillum sp.]|nr:proline racemase family protein [Noviherbaspirillum sp.]